MLKEIGKEATYFYHPDHLGSVSVVSNHQGVPYERVEYLPFGEVWIEEVDPATSYIPFRFTSKELDRETGLYYYGARYYEPKLSRWMSADPAGFGLVNPNRRGYSVIGATNWYSHTSNNPVNYVDPTGMLEIPGQGLLSGKASRLAGLFERAATLAAMANFSNKNIPGYTDVTGDERFSDLITKYGESGLDFRIFESEKGGDYVVAFRGLNPVSGEDWDAAYDQALFGITEGQFDDALGLVEELVEEGGIDASNLTLTGNSLGGALAAYAGSHMNVKTITFNAAGVHPDNVGPYTDMVTNFHMMGDLLTNAQNFSGLPSAIGNQIRVTPTPVDAAVALLLSSQLGPVAGSYYLHYIGKMERALKKGNY